MCCKSLFCKFLQHSSTTAFRRRSYLMLSCVSCMLVLGGGVGASKTRPLYHRGHGGGCGFRACQARWRPMALAFTKPSSTVDSGWWWSSVVSNDLGRCAVGLSVSVGVAGVAHSHCVPQLVRARRRRSFLAETWTTLDFLLGTPLVLARALASDAAELQWP